MASSGTVTSRSGKFISPAVWSGGGTVNVTITAGTFSAIDRVMITLKSASPVAALYVAYAGTFTTTSIIVHVTGPASTPSLADLYVTVIGVA